MTMRGLVEVAKETSGNMSSPPLGGGDCVRKYPPGSPQAFLKDFYSFREPCRIKELAGGKSDVSLLLPPALTIFRPRSGGVEPVKLKMLQPSARARSARCLKSFGLRIRQRIEDSVQDVAARGEPLSRLAVQRNHHRAGPMA